jgi:hypothetical protein
MAALLFHTSHYNVMISLKDYIRKSYNTKVSKILLLFIALNIIILPFALNPTLSTLALAKFVASLGLLLWLLYAAQTIPIHNMSPLILASMTLAIACNMFEMQSDGYINYIFQTKSETRKFDIEYLNRSLSFLALFVWVSAAAGRKIKYVPTILLLSMLYYLFHTKADATKVGLACGIIAYWMLSLHKRFIYVISSSTFLILLVTPLCVWYIVHHITPEMLESLPLSWRHRVYIWRNVFDLIQQSPWIGYGFNASAELHMLQQGQYVVDPVFGIKLKLFSSHPHNGPIQVLLEAGILGVWLYAAFWSQVLYMVYQKHEAHAKYAVGMVITYIVISLFSFNIWMSWWLGSIVLSYFMLLILFERNIRE